MTPSPMWIALLEERRTELITLSDVLRRALGRSVIRRERVWPQLGEHALVLSRRDGEPWRDRPGVITDRRGGNLRIGPDGKPRPPALVEYRVDGYVNWYPWFCLRVVEGEGA